MPIIFVLIVYRGVSTIASQKQMMLSQIVPWRNKFGRQHGYHKLTNEFIREIVSNELAEQTEANVLPATC